MAIAAWVDFLTRWNDGIEVRFADQARAVEKAI